MPTPREDLVGSCLIGAIILAALVRTVTSRPFHVPGPATAAQAHQIYVDGVENEVEERADSARRFRGSPWSQDDDFHNKEMKRAKNVAKTHDVSMTSLLDAIDRGMRQHWSTPSGTVPNPKVMPCRPRLSY